MIKYTLTFSELRSKYPTGSKVPVQDNINFQARDDVDAWIWVRKFVNYEDARKGEDTSAVRKVLGLSRAVNPPSTGFKF